MSNKILTAEVTKVQIGIYEIDGLLLSDGRFGIGLPQINENQLNLVPQKNASRVAKSLLGEGFQFIKAKTSLNPKAINVILLTDFERLLAKLDRKGNLKAQEIRDGLVGLSLHQLFCDAFDIKFEKEDRQDWLIKRQGTKYTFREMTDSLKEFGFKNGSEYAMFVYRLQSKLDIKTGTRDLQDSVKLQELLIAQTKIKAYVECGLTPFQALEKI
jgi:hypothetical protein